MSSTEPCWNGYVLHSSIEFTVVVR